MVNPWIFPKCGYVWAAGVKGCDNCNKPPQPIGQSTCGVLGHGSLSQIGISAIGTCKDFLCKCKFHVGRLT